MKFKVIIPILALFASMPAQAASFVVWPGQSLQAAIDTAAAGDNITVQTGTYNENISITKGIDIRGTGGAVLVTGTLAVTNAALPVYVADITFGKSGASGFTFTGTGGQNVRMDRCKLIGGGNLASTGTIAYFYKQQFDASVAFTGSTWTFQRCTVEGGLASTNSIAKCIASTVNGNFDHTGASAGELTVFQSDLREQTNIVLPAGKQGWVAYSTLRFVIMSGPGVYEFVGNHVNGRNYGPNWNGANYMVRTNTGCTAFIRNNTIWDDSATGNTYGAYGIYIEADSRAAKIFNNNVFDVYRGINVDGSIVGVEVRGNIHRTIPDGRDGEFSINAYPGALVTNNNFQGAVYGGTASDNINVDPLLVTGPNGEGNWLSASSPSRNVGPSDAQFNDLDGSRNDQGAWGGHGYDPTGRTTLKPVVLSGEISPLYVKRGGAVTIKARAAVSAAP